MVDCHGSEILLIQIVMVMDQQYFCVI